MSDYGKTWEEIRRVREQIRRLDAKIDASSLASAKQEEARRRHGWDRAFGSLLSEDETRYRARIDRLFRKWEQLEEKAETA
jgi:hypothetical protein